ncbi:MAG: GNAT family N-acetyltransferase [Bordetella sp.]|uniref:bifunctional acetate--CoA ligase family protein/GNAT family N-acetyltransferase n=1 Tax=Bordetella sp. TaxID=28081 RepID=UPI003F7C3B3A
MLRHALAPLFEPDSLVIAADRDLPVLAVLLAELRARTTVATCEFSRVPVLPAACTGLAPGRRPDLALVCVAPQALPETLRRLAALAPRSAIVLPHELPDAHPAQTRELCAEWARQHDCTLLGPHSFGVQRPHSWLNLSQYPTLALPGRVALVTQSRSIAAAVMDWAEDAHIGFSTVVSLGGEAGVDLPQTIDYLASDARSDSIVLYLENPGFAREFMSALRAAASVKPVIVLKAGHGDAVFDAALRRAGAVRVRYFMQLFSAMKVLGHVRRPKGGRVAVLSNGNGPPQLAMDVVGIDGSTLPAGLEPGTRRALQALLEPGAAVDNPVISYAPLTPERIQGMLDGLLADAGVDGVLALLAPDPLTDMHAVAEHLAKIAPKARKPVITCLMGDAAMRPLRRMLDDAGTPAFRTPETAMDAFRVLVSYNYNQQLLQQTQPLEPPALPPDFAGARAVIARAREEGRQELTVAQAQTLLDAFQVPLQVMPEGAAGAEPESHPVSVRVSRDSRLGPVMQFGASGPQADLPGWGGSMELPPLNGYLARRLLERSRLWRGVIAPGVEVSVTESLQHALVQISELICELPDVEMLAIDPLHIGATHLRAAGVRMRITREAAGSPQLGGYPHMAIHPYPTRLVQVRRMDDGTPWVIRPIRPEDGDSLQTFIRGLSERSRYMRFVSMLRELTPRMLTRYTQIDYHRELALVACTQVPNPEHRGHPREVIIGFAHYLRNADGRGAEYALVIGDDWQKRHLGGQLMQALIAEARDQGLEYIEGLILSTNRPMLTLMTRLGMVNDADPEDPTMRRVWMDLK